MWLGLLNSFNQSLSPSTSRGTQVKLSGGFTEALLTWLEVRAKAPLCSPMKVQERHLHFNNYTQRIFFLLYTQGWVRDLWCCILNCQNVETTQMSINCEWIIISWYSLTMRYYSGIKKDKWITYATIWMNVKSLMLSENSQTQKATYCMILFISHSGKSKSVDTKIRSVARWWGGARDWLQMVMRKFGGEK